MKPRPQAALLCTATLWLALTAATGVLAQDRDASNAPTPGVVQRVADAVERGAQAAARGIERGAKAAEHGIRVGVQATAQAAATVAKKVDAARTPATPPPAAGQAGAASGT